MTSATDKELEQKGIPPAEEAEAAAQIEPAPEADAGRPRAVSRSLRARGPRRGSLRTRTSRERGEFDQITIAARRVARVMAGGRRFNFSVAVVIGDHAGRVGVGLGKASDTALAVEKATRDAKKHLIFVPRTAANSIPHAVCAKYASSVVEVMPSKGRGLVAGSAVRTVLDLGGISDVVTKIHSRSKNKLTIARATVQALKGLRSKA